MPRRRHDSSPGDARQPFSDEGGPAGRHAQTHDVRREELTRPRGTVEGEDFSADLAPSAPADASGGHGDDSVPATEDKELHSQLDDLDRSELAGIAVLEPGTRLHQGSTYVDLNDLASGPFTAIGGQEAGPDDRYVAKRDTDHELWNRLVGQGRAPPTERPRSAGDGGG